MLVSLSDNQNMGSWTNLGGNGNPATSTDGTPPKFRTHVNYALNGYPVANFNGNNDRLLLADTPDLNLEAIASARTQRGVYHRNEYRFPLSDFRIRRWSSRVQYLY
jgi:hypothetical protein